MSMIDKCFKDLKKENTKLTNEVLYWKEKYRELYNIIYDKEYFEDGKIK